MKTQFLGAALIGMIAFSAFTFNHQETYTADTKLSSLEWVGEKATGQHSGTINLSSGTIVNDHGNLSAQFEVDMTSIRTTDITGEDAKDLDNHLKNDDFFGADKFPKAKFVSTSITPIPSAMAGGNTHTIKGNLTIKEKTNEITFDAVIKGEGNKIACVGTATVDRVKYDIKYKSKTAFPELGNKFISDEFKVKFSVVAVK